eukprot:11025959-Lingulodinium_polyedra.AAC.1
MADRCKSGPLLLAQRSCVVLHVLPSSLARGWMLSFSVAAEGAAATSPSAEMSSIEDGSCGVGVGGLAGVSIAPRGRA